MGPCYRTYSSAKLLSQVYIGVTTRTLRLVKQADEHNLKIEALIAHHEEERQTMITQHAARFAESESSKLKSKIETLELQVSHYSELAGQLPRAQCEGEMLRKKEAALVQQIARLGAELEEVQQ